MEYNCSICGINEVECEGGICDLCSISQDPYAQALSAQMQSSNPTQPVELSQSGGTAKQQFAAVGAQPYMGTGKRKILVRGTGLTNQDVYGNGDVTGGTGSNGTDGGVKVYQNGQAVDAGTSSASKALTAGITKNISVDTEEISFIVKWFRALFSGIPVALDESVTTFQVFPDYSGSALNSLGNACDQVVIYGKVTAGTISDNNEVEVYGHRRSDNTIIASQICNRASGSMVSPQRVIPVAAVWLITLLIFGLLAVSLTTLGAEGIIWAVVLVICLTNLSRVFKILSVIFGFMFKLIKKLL